MLVKKKERPSQCIVRSARVRWCQGRWWRIPIRSLYDHASMQTIQSIIAMQMVAIAKICTRIPFFVMIREAWSCGGHRFQPHATTQWQIRTEVIRCFPPSFRPGLLFLLNKIVATATNRALQYPSSWLETKPHPTGHRNQHHRVPLCCPWKGNHILIDLDTTEVDPHTS